MDFPGVQEQILTRVFGDLALAFAPFFSRWKPDGEFSIEEVVVNDNIWFIRCRGSVDDNNAVFGTFLCTQIERFGCKKVVESPRHIRMGFFGK